MKRNEFVARVKFAWKNARRASKALKKDGIVFLPNGSVVVDPRRSLGEFGYEVRSTS